MFNRVAVGAEHNTFRRFFLDGFKACSTRNQVRDVRFFIAVVVVEVEGSVIVKTTAGTG